MEISISKNKFQINKQTRFKGIDCLLESIRDK